MPTTEVWWDVKGWPWGPDRCPADEQFIEWLGLVHPSALSPPAFHGSVFHMGTGLHHRVGQACDARGLACLGVTISYEELTSWAGQNWAPSYQVMLADIYTLDPRLLPEFTVMTLFHLGEMQYLFGPIDEPAIERLIGRVESLGFVLFYTHSADWGNHASIAVKHFEESGLIVRHGEYKDLSIWRKS